MNGRRLQPWMLVSLAWIVPAILGGLDTWAQYHLRGSPVPWGHVLFTSLDWFLYALLTPGVFALSRRWPVERPRAVERVLLHMVFALAFCAAWAGGGTLLRGALDPSAFDDGVAFQFVTWLFITLPFGVSVYLCMVGMEHAIRWFGAARERDIQVARLSEQLAGARFAALQAQLNPHFLFNTLNTIAVLVRDGDRAGAVRLVELLSDILRRTLGRHRASEVALEEELELVRQYLAIEQARFADRLRAEVDAAPETLRAALPGFALQHLVENAIRHGIARRPGAGRVRVTARRDGASLVLEVTDDGPGIDAAEPPGHGLANTRERLRALYGDGASLTLARAAGGGTVATLRIPWHEASVEVAPGG